MNNYIIKKKSDFTDAEMLEIKSEFHPKLYLVHIFFNQAITS